MNKKNKVLTAAVCGVIVSSIGAGFLLNKPKEEAKAFHKEDKPSLLRKVLSIRKGWRYKTK